MTRLRSGKDISDVGDSTNNLPVNTIGDDTEKQDNLVPLEQTQSLSGAPTSPDSQEIEMVDTTATATAIEGSNGQTIFLNGMKLVQDAIARMNSTFQTSLQNTFQQMNSAINHSLQEITSSFTKMNEAYLK